MVTAFPEQVQRLTELGLTKSEARVYLALLGRGAVTASEAAQLTELPRQRIYNLLRGLTEKGLCVEIRDQVLKYRACQPSQALTGLLVDRNREFQTRLEEQQQLARLLAEHLKPLAETKAFANGNSLPSELIEVYHNPNQILREYNRLLLECRYELLGMAKLPYVQAKADPTFEKVAEGVSVRHIIAENVLEKAPAMVEAIFRLYGFGEQRFLPELPLKLYIFDEQKVMFHLSNGGTNKLMALIMDSPQMALAQKLLFESLWEQAVPASEYQERILAAVMGVSG